MVTARPIQLLITDVDSIAWHLVDPTACDQVDSKIRRKFRRIQGKAIGVRLRAEAAPPLTATIAT